MSNVFFFVLLFCYFVGFDCFNDLFELVLCNEVGSIYLFYNVEKYGDDEYCIVIVVVGFQEEDLDLQVECGVLIVSGGKCEKFMDNVIYLYQGIVQCVFKLLFCFVDYIEVKVVLLVNGLLNIDLVWLVLEEVKLKCIVINGQCLVLDNQ